MRQKRIRTDSVVIPMAESTYAELLTAMKAVM